MADRTADARRIYEVKRDAIARFDQVWAANYEANRGVMSRSPGVSSFFGKFGGVPAVIVGAGPSLGKNIMRLRAARDKAVVICVDTILHALDAEGIRPDITVTLDPQPEVESFFEGVDTAGKTLVAPTIASPAALDAWKGEKVFYNKFAPDVPALQRIAQANPDIGFLIPGGSVLSVGLDLAFRMGADPIAFIGQDLSYPPGQPAYAEGTLYGNSDYQALVGGSTNDIVTDTDIFGRQVPTRKSLHVTKQWMEWAFDTLKRDTPASFYNCTEGGIVKGRCDVITLQEWLARFANKKVNVTWAIRKALKRKKR